MMMSPFFAKITVMLVYENNFEQQQKKIDARWGTKMTKKDKQFLKNHRKFFWKAKLP